MNRSLKTCLAVAIFALIFTHSPLQAFDAYYTKIVKGLSWEKDERTHEHADIIVRLDHGQFIFWRGSSYLPLWKSGQKEWYVPEVIQRSGDGTDLRHDDRNMFSRVSLISSNEKEIVVHWRYLPTFVKGNPKTKVDHLKFVDEYFTIKPDGSVKRTIQQGTPKIDDWLAKANVITQTFELKQIGIENVETVHPDKKRKPYKYHGNAVKGPVVGKPVLHFKFNEGQGDVTADHISKDEYAIEGNKSYWKAGVSGNGLAFDGYDSAIRVPASKAPKLENFTIDAWVTLPAYPFNWAPIVQQSKWEEAGFWLGIDAYGRIGFKVASGDWIDLQTAYEIPLRKWTHIAATYNGTYLRIYVNSKEIASITTDGKFKPSNTELVVGMNSHKSNPVDPVRDYCEECHTETEFGIDGLIDELKIYDTALSAKEITKSYKHFFPGNIIANDPDIFKRVLPTGPTFGQFNAYYTHLKYYDTWDNLARFGDYTDIVVEFDESPSKFIFWRGMNYIPQVVNGDDQWYNNQFNESWDPGGSWGEPMSDKKSNNSHVRLIEDTPARKVIHWRYAQVQINGTQQNFNKKTNQGDWSDWYYYIYPDGVASKRMLHYSYDNPEDHEWQESIGVMGPGQTPESISYVYGDSVTFDDFKETDSYSWKNENPLELEGKWESRPMHTQLIHYKSDYSPFTVGDFRGGENYGDADGRIAPFSKMVVYIHWPLGQLPTDGARPVKPDRASSNGWTHLMFKKATIKGKHWAQRTMLEGMTDKSILELRPLAKSWLHAPEVIQAKGGKSLGYEQAQRAYLFELKDKFINFNVDASEGNPIENICFVVKKWNSKDKATLKINGREIQPGKSFRQGVIIDTDGTDTLVVYAKISSTKITNFEISKK